MSVTSARRRLEEAGARPPSAGDPTLDGLAPALVLEPSGEDACARALELCHDEELAVVPVGGGTRLELGNTPSRLDAYLSTRGLRGVVDHVPGDLTVCVGAGTRLDELQGELRKSGQFLPLDPPRASRATVGGVLAVGEPGFRRRPGGRPRDLLLGFTALLADGTKVRAGGRVVKNVAGYEITKLFVGSAGTLAVMTSAFLRLRALPELVLTVCAEGDRAADPAAVWERLGAAGLEPEAAVLASPRTARRWSLAGWSLFVRYEGLEEEVRAMAQACLDEIARASSASRASLLDEREARPMWETLRDFPLEGEGPLGLRGQVAPAATFSLAEAWQDGGDLIACPDGGLVHSSTDEPTALPDRLEQAKRLGARAVVERAPAPMKKEIDVYGETPGGFELMKGIKKTMDPKDILSPGRFVGRI